MEAIQFNADSKQFEFHQILFADDHTQPAIFDRNIQSCANCHQSPARPNWESYDVWEGAYGQVEDQIKVGSREDIDFQVFLANQRNSGRYKFLSGPRDMRAPSLSELADHKKPALKSTYSVSTLPNERLTILFNILNYQRIALAIAKTPDFSRFKYAYYGALFGCGPIEEFIPATIRKAFVATYDQIFNDTMQRLSNQYSKRMQEDGPFDSFTLFNHKKAPQNFEAVSASRFIIAKLRYLTEGRGISTANWTLSPNPNAYTFSDGDLYLKEVARSYETELREIPGLVLDYVNLNFDTPNSLFGIHGKDFSGARRFSCCNYDKDDKNSNFASPNCKILKKLSSDAFQSSEITAAAEESTVVNMTSTQGFHRSPEEVINTCIGCHSTSGSSFHFKSLLGLIKLLGQSGFAHGTLKKELQYRLKAEGADQMPPYQGLMSNEERAGLAAYLEQK